MNRTILPDANLKVLQIIGSFEYLISTFTRNIFNIVTLMMLTTIYYPDIVSYMFALVCFTILELATIAANYKLTTGEYIIVNYMMYAFFFFANTAKIAVSLYVLKYLPGYSDEILYIILGESLVVLVGFAVLLSLFKLNNVSFNNLQYYRKCMASINGFVSPTFGDTKR